MVEPEIATETATGELDAAPAPPAPATHLAGRNLIAARLAFASFTLLTVVLFLIGVPFHAPVPHLICADVTCSGSQPLAQVVSQLKSIGLTLPEYTTYILAVKLAFGLGYGAVAALICWRRSDDWLALLVALFLITFAFLYTDVPGVLARDHVPWWWLVGLVALVGNIAFPLCLYLFPTGRFTPSWAIWLLLVWIVLVIPASFAPGSAADWATWPAPLEVAVVLVALGSGSLSQVYRFRYISSPRQQRQTMWVVYGLAVGLGGFFVTGLIGSLGPRVIGPALHIAWLGSPWVGIAANTLTYLFLLVIPISFAMAILRAKLWDIDVLINRTLVGSIVTGVLAVVFTATVLLVQTALHGILGGSQVAIVISTLASTALFRPLVNHTQTGVDRVFYHHKYVVTRQLARFGATLKHQVELEELSSNVLAVVDETMAPGHVSLWLRPEPWGRSPDV